jgi:quercetin dioxygenase-like cupin family protein
MRTRVFASLALAGAACVGMVAAQDTKPDPKKAPPTSMPTRAVKMTAPGDLKWETDPESKLSIAVLSGNPKTGPYEAFVKFPAGIELPLHWHTFSNTAVGVSGTLVVTGEGQEAKELSAGSWGVVPGRLNHTTRCKEGADCVIYARRPGKNDIHFVNAPKKMKEPPRK